jgi:hypothetical protein
MFGAHIWTPNGQLIDGDILFPSRLVRVGCRKQLWCPTHPTLPSIVRNSRQDHLQNDVIAFARTMSHTDCFQSRPTKTTSRPGDTLRRAPQSACEYTREQPVASPAIKHHLQDWSEIGGHFDLRESRLWPGYLEGFEI